MRIAIVLLLLSLIFAFPQTIRAKEVDISARLSVEVKAMQIFSEIFDNSHERNYIPHSVRVLDTFFHKEYAHLVLNLSPEVLNYGGTHFEWHFVQILLMNAANMEEVGYFTVLIDGQLQYLPEGTKIHELRIYGNSY